jgi:nucleotide-binding universal stress UspA family protein
VKEQRGQVIAVLDQSRLTEHVLRWATAEAIYRAAPLRLIQTFLLPMTPFSARLGDAGMLLTWPELYERNYTRSASQLSHVQRSLAAVHPELRVNASVECGSVVAVSAAHVADALLTVIGSRRTYNIPDALFGSGLAGIIGRSTGTVAVIRPPRSCSGPLEPSVVVSLDGAAGFGTGLGLAFEAAAARTQVLCAVHIWDAAATCGPFEHRLAAHAQAMIDREKHRRMDEELTGWRARFPTVEVRSFVLHGRTTPALLRFCRGHSHGTEPALVVMISPSSRTVRGGSRARATIRSFIARSPCPVVVVPSG